MSDTILVPVSARDQRLIADRIFVLRDWYNSHPQVRPCAFHGEPSDLATLTFISYELGTDLWSWDHGQTLSYAWGNVFVRRLSFQWVQSVNDGSMPSLALYNAEVPLTIFPWSRLSETLAGEESSHSAPEELFLAILCELHLRNAVPTGWHPVLDALSGHNRSIPDEVVRQIRKLIANEQNWFRLLGLFPYEWNVDVSWDMVSAILSNMIDASDTRRKGSLRR